MIDFRRPMSDAEYARATLLLLRDRRATDWASLSRQFGLNPESSGTFMLILHGVLANLRSAGLVEFQDSDPGGVPPISGPIQLSANWESIRSALGLSLTELAQLGPDAIVARPIFGKPRGPNQATDVFVLMPFSPDLDYVYVTHIVRVATRLSLTASRADDRFSLGAVMSDVWAGILGCRAIIADCTGKNANVFYELGLAHAVGKPVVLITQHEEDVPFDVRQLRHILYEPTPRGMQLFEQQLSNSLGGLGELERR